jgi:hypothetical protein
VTGAARRKQRILDIRCEPAHLRETSTEWLAIAESNCKHVRAADRHSKQEI